MSANMLIDQAGLPPGTPGQARTDGLLTGALVTLTSVSGGLTCRFQLLWVPPGDVTAVGSLTQTGPTTWTFSPTPGVWGSYRIELIVDEGLPTEERQVRIFGVRSPVAGLLVPAANERADAGASLINAGAAVIARSEQNEPFGPFITGSAWGWWRALSELATAVEAGGGGGGGKQSNRIIVGNAAAGDTLAICDFLETGTGTAIPTALAAAAFGPYDVFVRPGFYPSDGTTWNVPPGVLLQGASSRQVFIGTSTTKRQAFAINGQGLLRGVSLLVPPADPGAVDQSLIVCADGGLDGVVVNASSMNPASVDETLLRLVQVVASSLMPTVKNCYLESTQQLGGGLRAIRGLEVSGGAFCSLLRTRVVNCDDGIWIGGERHQAIGCSVQGGVRTGIQLLNAIGCRVLGSDVEAVAGAWPGVATGIGIAGLSGQNMVATNRVLTGAPDIGILLDSASGHDYGTNNVSSNVIENAGGVAIQLNAAEAASTVVANNTRGGTINDFGAGVPNVVALNNTGVTP